jgi:DNA-binding transcriptional ArsR family regulator
MPSLPHDHGPCGQHFSQHMPGIDDFLVISDVFKQLADPTRIRLFWLLCHCEECVINLSALMEMSSPAVSHHLKQLRAGGLITSRRDGKEVYYKAATNQQAKMLHDMIKQLVNLTCPEHCEN